MPDRNSTLPQAFLNHQRKRLEALRKEFVWIEEPRLKSERARKWENGQELETIDDQARDMAGSEIVQTLHAADERRLRAVDRALEKIEEGTYGFSDLSGKRIPKARLEVVPEAVLTVGEEKQAERRNR